MFEFDKIINRLIEKLNIKNKTELANILDVSTQVMGNWKTRNKIPFEEIHTVCLNKNIDINYIFYGNNEEKNEENINFKEKIVENLEKLSEKELKYFYHLMEAEITKREF